MFPSVCLCEYMQLLGCPERPEEEQELQGVESLSQVWDQDSATPLEPEALLFNPRNLSRHCFEFSFFGWFYF